MGGQDLEGVRTQVRGSSREDYREREGTSLGGGGRGGQCVRS